MKYNKKNNKWIGVIVFLIIAIIMYYIVGLKLILQHGLQLLSFSAAALIIYYFFSDVIFQKRKTINVPEEELDMFAKHGVKTIVAGSKRINLVKRKKKRVFTDEELDKVGVWLKSPEGIKALKDAQGGTSEVEKIIENMNKIDPQLLKEPFNI